VLNDMMSIDEAIKGLPTAAKNVDIYGHFIIGVYKVPIGQYCMESI